MLILTRGTARRGTIVRVRVVFSVGEASGDAVAAVLASEIADLDLVGVGGRRMAAAGVELLADSSKWGAISIVQSLGVAARAAEGYAAIVRELGRGRPGVFVPVDFGWMNVRLARKAKEKGWRVLYLMPPGSWRRDRQGADLPAVTDLVVTPFPWSAELLRAAGARAEWFGHPLLAVLARDERPAFSGEYVAVLPGSRGHEVTENLLLLAAALGDLGLPLRFALAPSADATAVESAWRELCPDRIADEFDRDITVPTLRGARAAVVCSGTATLEAAILGCPTVVVYALSPGMRREARLLRIRRPLFVALPNILLQRMAVPEHAERDGVDPAAVRASLDGLLVEGAERSAQLTAFEELRTLLGPGETAIKRTAEEIRKMLAQ